MKSVRVIILVFCLMPLISEPIGAASVPQAKSSSAALDQVLERMGSVGKTFRSFQADFTQRQYVAVLKEFEDPGSGFFIYARANDGSALIRQEFKAPGYKILTIKGGVALFYQPSLKQAMKYNLGKHKDKAEFLALGVGQSPAKLRETFNIEYRGEEAVDGVSCSVLLLIPKSSSVAAYYSAITLWIRKSDSVSIQQKLQEPSGNYLINKFSSVRLNAKISESQFEQTLPKGVEIQVVR
jgi:outer membrane lipoprotein-sorting protein